MFRSKAVRFGLMLSGIKSSIAIKFKALPIAVTGLPAKS